MPELTKTLDIPRLPVPRVHSLRRRFAAETWSVDRGGQMLYTTSGRAALVRALRILGVAPGDTVLLPSYHCPTMVAPVLRLGARPVFYPIGRDAAPDLGFIESLPPGSAKAMLAAHFFGLPLPMRAVRAVCDRLGMALIEDCAHSFFGASTEAPVATVGNAAIASLPKFFPVSEGGCLILSAEYQGATALVAQTLGAQTRSIVDALEIGAHFRGFGAFSTPLNQLFRLQHWVRGRRPKLADVPAEPDVPVDKTKWLDDELCERRPTWMTRWLASHVDQVQLIRQRRSNYRLFAELLADAPGARPLFPDLGEQAVPYVFPLEVDRPEAAYRRIRSVGVPVFRWDQVWPGTPTMKGDHGLTWARSVFQLGCHQDMSEADVRDVCREVRFAICEEGY